ncbi:uncharacterized protein LOC132038020 [Lycium ferocissimum]|uniref:uncharacterized protein LOC132038020 n=1 Tax=Lycium ferocissimum TaxID=112874 RepID=UPI0028164FB9|nr:uncharacterized protein LOC132038020 [Lycium ferocissimum]
MVDFSNEDDLKNIWFRRSIEIEGQVKQIVRTVGTHLSMDMTTENRTMPSMAKVKVEVDLTKPKIKKAEAKEKQKGEEEKEDDEKEDGSDNEKQNQPKNNNENEKKENDGKLNRRKMWKTKSKGKRPLGNDNMQRRWKKFLPSMKGSRPKRRKKGPKRNLL